MSIRRAQIAVALVVWAVSLGVQAQESEDGGVIIDVDGVPEDPRAPSGWRSVLSTERLRLSGGELGEALIAQPGVYVRRFAGPGGRQTLSLRGTSSQQAKVILGGVALDPVGGGGVDLGLLPPALISRVEVHRGGAGARFGSGALGGAVLLQPDIPAEGLKLTVSGGLASAGTARATVGAAGGLDWLRGIATVDVLSTEGDFRFEDGQGNTRTRIGADVRRLGVMAGVELRPSPKSKVSLTELLVLSDRGQPGPSEFQARLDEARSEERRSTLVLGATQRDLVSSKTLAIDGELHLGWRTSSAHYTNPDRLLASSAPYDTLADEEAFEGGGTASIYAWRTLIGHLTVEAAQAQLVRRELVALNEREEEVFERGRLAAALSVEWLAFGESLSVLPSVRVEGIEGFPVQALPSVGVRWSTESEVWTLMSNAGRAWRAPSFDELFLRAEFVEGNASLRPEEALSLDLGVSWRPVRWLRAEAVGFMIAIDEQILFLPVSATLYRAQNTGRAVSRGAEVGLTSAPLPWLRLSGSWTLTDARFDVAPRDPLPGRPLHKVAAEVALVRPQIEVFARVTARSEVFLDNFGNLKNGPASFVDLGILSTPWRGWSVGVVGRNILDERGALDALQSPLPGFSISAQVGWTLETRAE